MPASYAAALRPSGRGAGAALLWRRPAAWPSGLGTGLQSLLQRFDSARRLQEIVPTSRMATGEGDEPRLLVGLGGYLDLRAVLTTRAKHRVERLHAGEHVVHDPPTEWLAAP